MPSYAKFDIWQNTAGITRQSVIQVVQMTTTSRVSTSSTTFVDAAGYTATITPTSASNKILVLSTLYHGSTTSHAIWFRLFRDTTAIADAVGYSGGASNAVYMNMCSPINYLDSPGTASAVTYKIQFKSDNASATVFLGGPPTNTYGGGTALNNNTILLLEIAS